MPDVPPRELTHTAAGRHTGETFSNLVSRHYERLWHYVRHMIAYHEARGDLVPGDLRPEEVVDAAMVRAHRLYRETPPVSVRRWLVRLAREELEREVRRRREAQTGVISAERRVPQVPPREEVTTLGEEILYFHEPEEKWKVEDILPDLSVPRPDQEVESRELRSCVRTALQQLPLEVRQALVLRYVDDFDGEDLAEAMGRPEPEIRRVLREGREELRSKLQEAGCRFMSEA